MKSIEEVKKVVGELTTESNAAGFEDKPKYRRSLKFLKNVVLYLEHNPTKESIEKQLESDTKRLARIDEEFKSDFPVGCPDSKIRSKWRKDKGIAEINSRGKLLKYILGDQQL